MVDTLSQRVRDRKACMGRSGKERNKEENKSDLSSRWVDFNSGYIQKSPRELSVLIFLKVIHMKRSPQTINVLISVCHLLLNIMYAISLYCV